MGQKEKDLFPKGLRPGTLGFADTVVAIYIGDPSERFIFIEPRAPVVYLGKTRFTPGGQFHIRVLTTAGDGWCNPWKIEFGI